MDLALEKSIFARGYHCIAATDEAGRGPLAGPVVAACLVFGPEIKINHHLAPVKDSKKLTARKRQELYDIIMKEFEQVGVGWCDNKTIDKINILQASFLAMKKALGAVRIKPDYVLLDGQFNLPNCSFKQQAVIKGDAKIFSIAAASIVAKVRRDCLMREFHEEYPDYGFDLHKGYGTKLHLERLKQFGPCQIHRISFKPVSQFLRENGK